MISELTLTGGFIEQTRCILTLLLIFSLPLPTFLRCYATIPKTGLSSKRKMEVKRVFKNKLLQVAPAQLACVEPSEKRNVCPRKKADSDGSNTKDASPTDGGLTRVHCITNRLLTR